MYTSTIKIDSKQTKMIAHQGLYGLERGNSNQAFIAAGNREKYYGIETDLYRTADGHYVCIHPENTKPLSGVDMDVQSSTLEALQSIRLMDKVRGTEPEPLKTALFGAFPFIVLGLRPVNLRPLHGKALKNHPFSVRSSFHRLSEMPGKENPAGNTGAYSQGI